MARLEGPGLWMSAVGPDRAVCEQATFSNRCRVQQRLSVTGAAHLCDAPPRPRYHTYGMFPIMRFASSTEKPRNVSLRTLPSEPDFSSAVVTASSVPSRMITMS